MFLFRLTVIPRPTDLNLALIIGLAAAGLFLLLLVFFASLFATVALRRRRRAKAVDAGDLQAVSSTSTTSVNLTASDSSCSRGSRQSVDSDVPDGPPTPPPPQVSAPGSAPVPPSASVLTAAQDSASLPAQVLLSIPRPALPPDQFRTEQQTELGEQPEILIAMSCDDLSGSLEELPIFKPYSQASRAPVARSQSWTTSLPSVVGFPATTNLRKVPPAIAKKTAKAQSAARGAAHSRPPGWSSSAHPLDSGGVTSTSADPLPGVGPERPRPAGPTGSYVHVPPKLHREPRGWAPASHVVPAPVKRTWGRAKAKLAAERDRELSEGISPSVTLSSLSLALPADDDNSEDMGSTLTIA